MTSRNIINVFKTLLPNNFAMNNPNGVTNNTGVTNGVTNPNGVTNINGNTNNVLIGRVPDMVGEK